MYQIYPSAESWVLTVRYVQTVIPFLNLIDIFIVVVVIIVGKIANFVAVGNYMLKGQFHPKIVWKNHHEQKNNTNYIDVKYKPTETNTATNAETEEKVKMQKLKIKWGERGKVNGLSPSDSIQLRTINTPNKLYDSHPNHKLMKNNCTISTAISVRGRDRESKREPEKEWETSTDWRIGKDWGNPYVEFFFYLGFKCELWIFCSIKNWTMNICSTRNIDRIEHLWVFHSLSVFESFLKLN